MEKIRYLGMAACLLAFALAGPASAYNQPLGLNLGYTSFMDGAPPAGPGFYFTEYVQYYTADDFSDAAFPTDDAEVEAWVSLNQFIYQSNTPVLFGGKWGLDFIVPYVWIDSSPDTSLPENSSGFGDIWVGPYLQWDPIMGEKGPIFMHRVEFQMIFPTGSYENDKVLNPSANAFAFDPYWAGTYFITPKWTVSGRFHYLWNAENDDPFVGFGLDEVQAGEALHANFATSYEVLPRQLRVGVNGYWLDQISATKGTTPAGNTIDLRDDEMVLAVGPGALLSFSQDTHLFFNAYFETETDARPEGERFILRLVHHF
jgi:anthranilate 1,2-dioxygenase (deaminating, decarboxylating) large subunit